jgi:hypothetical protein
MWRQPFRVGRAIESRTSSLGRKPFQNNHKTNGVARPPLTLKAARQKKYE